MERACFEMSRKLDFLKFLLDSQTYNDIQGYPGGDTVKRTSHAGPIASVLSVREVR